MRLELLLLSLPLIVTVKAITAAQNADSTPAISEFNFPNRNVAIPIHKIPKPIAKPIFIRPLAPPAPTESVPAEKVSIATEPVQPLPKPLPLQPEIPPRPSLQWPPVRPTLPPLETQPPADPELPTSTATTYAPLPPSTAVPPNKRPPYQIPLGPGPIPNPHLVRPVVTSTQPLVQSPPYSRPPLPYRPTLTPRAPVTFVPTPIPIPKPQPQPEPIPKPQPDTIPEPQPQPKPHRDPEPEPQPDLVPVPLPDPVPEPQPDPIPKPQPLPVPRPKPDLLQPRPVPWPRPLPQPQPIPQPIPVPRPQPIPQPIPQPVPTYRPLTTQKPKPTFNTTRLPYSPQPRPDQGIPIDYNCIQDGYYDIANECDTYIECRKRSALKYVCPDGLNFNRNALYSEYPCAYPSEVQCDSKARSRDPQPTSQCPRQYGFFPMNDGDCSRYLMCQEGMATIMNCPLGLAFNYQQNACDWPGNVPSCQPSVFQGFTCPPAPVDEYGEPYDWIYKYKYGQSCKEYVACQQGHPRLLSCDPGLAFDDASETCVNEDYIPGCSNQSSYLV